MTLREVAQKLGGYAHVNRGRGGRAGAASYKIECFVKVGNVPKERREAEGWTLFCGCKNPEVAGILSAADNKHMNVVLAP